MIDGDRQIEVYQIVVRGWLDACWSDWFGGIAITHHMGCDGLPVTTITGAVTDQAALRGVLWKLWDLNLKLISVAPVEREAEGKGPARPERRNPNG